MDPHTRLFLAELRCGKRSALTRLTVALRLSGGSVSAAAERLGVGLRTLYDLRNAQPEVAARLKKHGMGLSGAARAARESRRKHAVRKTT